MSSSNSQQSPSHGGPQAPTVEPPNSNQQPSNQQTPHKPAHPLRRKAGGILRSPARPKLTTTQGLWKLDAEQTQEWLVLCFTGRGQESVGLQEARIVAMRYTGAGERLADASDQELMDIFEDYERIIDIKCSRLLGNKRPVDLE